MNIPGTKRPQQPSRAPSPAPSSSSVYSTPRMNDGGSGGSGYGLGLSTNGGANWTGGHANGGQSYTQLQSQQQPQQPSAVDQQASLTAKTNLKRCIDALRFLASQWLSAARRAKVLEDLLDLKHVSLRDLEEDTFQTVNLDPDWTSNTGYALALRGPRERHDKLRQRCRSKVMAIQSLLANDDDHVTSHPHHPHPYKMTEKQQTSRHRRNFSDESMQEPVQQQQQEMDMGTTPSSLDMGMDPPPSVPSIKADQDITMEQAPSASTSVTSSTSTVPFTTLAHPTYLLKQEATLSGTAADKGVSSSSSCSPSSLVDQAMKEAGFGRVVPTPTLTQTSSLGLDFDPMMLLGSEDPGMVALTATTQNAGSAVSSSPSAVSASTSTTAPPSSLITSEAIMAGLGLSSATTSAPVSSIQILTPPSVSCAGGGIGGGVTSANMFDPFSMPSSITFPLGHSPMLAAAPPVATTNAATGGVMVNQAESMASPTLSTSSSSMSLLQEPVAQQQQSASTSSELDQSLGSLSSSGVEKKVAPTQQLLGQPVVSTVGSPTWEYHGQMGKAASTRTGLTVQEQEMQDLAWNDMPVTLGLDEWMAYIGALMMRWLASGESSPKASPPSL
ncbi:hypothetical protein BGZ73_000808 [Actinomortierella ambigua]|nr:hypothetical protein BGZ73_000808 [Actinomortierella ambigua]